MTSSSSPHSPGRAALVLGAIGIVFGDIGTSPLYTLQECWGPHGLPPTRENVLGVLSLIFWSLMMVVTLKYLLVLMRADNQGEGGIMALLALLPEEMRGTTKRTLPMLAVLVIVGAALLYGDGIITPAISVLSAIEGIKIAAPSMDRAVVPITCVILVGLFLVQSRGTGHIGRFFGPVMTVWFVTIAALGAWHVTRQPGVLAALWPGHAVRVFTHHGFHGFHLLGSVVLAVTGGEALYADMGHFGKSPIRVAWMGLVLPALLLCYFGQGAVVLRDPAAAAQPFFSMVPVGFAVIALVALATPATVIASQALISGVFSLTHQAVQLGFFPRVQIKHTGAEAEGQVYVPTINWGLGLACLALVIVFKESTKLAAAFGLAVSGTMGITSIVFYQVTRTYWRWPVRKALPLLLLFLSFDLPFLGANLLKFVDGGYIPILVGSLFFVAMAIWRVGRAKLDELVTAKSPPLEKFIANVDEKVSRVPGVGVFMSSRPAVAPIPLMHHAERIRVLHQGIVLLTIRTAHTPFVSDDDRLTFEDLGHGFHRIVGRFGFMETPNVPQLVERIAEHEHLTLDPAEVTYYFGRETFLAGPKGQMGPFSESIFAFLSRNAQSATVFFSVPPDQVVELGTQIDL